MNDDTISRKAAIDAVSWGCHEFRGIFADCEKNLNALPSAEQYGRWTPITDELPEIGDKTLVTIPSIGETFVTIGTYAGEYRWHISDYGFCEKIIAWMPLPHPYKVGEQNE